jgi:hypothetical protein
VEWFDPAWRPFTKPFPESRREIASKLLSAMCGWLVGSSACWSTRPMVGLS